MSIVKLCIMCATDRERIVVALANAGYHVWVEEVRNDYNYKTDFFVCFEDKDTCRRDTWMSII